MGSDVVMLFPSFPILLLPAGPASPTCFGHAGNLSGERKLPEANAAKHKLSDVTTRPSALEAAVAVAAGKFRRL
jgi:hypothetical protein